jgi:polyisoprenoid-binding protein YceI
MILPIRQFYRVLALTLAIVTPPALASSVNVESDVCAPFQDGKVDVHIIERMLQAANDGYLYRIEPDYSRVGFCVQSAIGLIEGEFKHFSGGFTMSVDPNEQALLLIETGSVSAPGMMVESLITGESFLDSSKYPEMLFVSTGFYWVNDEEAVLIGDLTIRGVTKKIGLHVKLEREDEELGDYGQHVTIKASTRIRRSEYGIISMSPLLNDEIDLCMTVEAVRIPAS